MLDQSAYSVNVVSSNGKEWTQYFPLQEQAGMYVRQVDGNTGLTVIEYNFEMQPDTVLDAFQALEKQVTENARRLEQWARRRTRLNYEDSHVYPCEVCHKPHSNYECCDACNYDLHRCHFCGDDLGHNTAFSMCYIMLEWEENYATLGIANAA